MSPGSERSAPEAAEGGKSAADGGGSESTAEAVGGGEWAAEAAGGSESTVEGAGGSESAAEAGGGESAARRIALDALSRSARTRGQLESLLQRKGIAPEAAEAVLDRFEEVGLVNDVGYAEAFVESRHRVRGQGGRALSAQLRQRGVAAEVIAEAVGGLDPDQEFETACRIARSRYERMPAVAPEVKVRRLAGFLARKGYSGAIVSRAVRHVVETTDESAGDVADAVEAVDVLDEME